jgi:SPP1 gp7 family putative phage head morphogenesis protein
MKYRTRKRPTANRRKAGSHMRLDPSRTAGLRRAFAAELTRRLARLRYNVVQFVGSKNAFGLVANRDFAFVESSRKLEEFRLWLAQELGVVGLTDEELFRRYAEAGYRKGAGRAFDDTRKKERALAIGDAAKLDFYAGSKEEFLRSAFGRPVAVEKIKHLASRAFSDLKGVTDAMGAQMARTLSDGLVQGKGPREVARQLAKDVDGIGRKRALLITRTETIRAHAEGALDAFEQLGIEEVGAQVEFLATDDDLVCPDCDSLSGVVFSIDEARGLIPQHPNCRCTWIPSVPSRKKAVTRNTRFPALKQSYSWDCGAECFRGVLWTFGIKKSESQVIHLLGTTPKDGTKFGVMSAAAREFGLEAVEFADSTDAQKLKYHLSLGHPVICPVQLYDGEYDAKDMARQEGHYVVALECDEETVTFADPTIGRKTVPWPEFVQRWHDQGSGRIGYVRSGLAFAGVTANAWEEFEPSVPEW